MTEPRSSGVSAINRGLWAALAVLIPVIALAAIDSRDKRASASHVGMGLLLPNADGAINAADRMMAAGEYNGIAPSAFVQTGPALSTIFVSGSLPSNAVYNAGAAYAPTGERYVADCTPPAVVYVFGIAYREDGAMCIVTSTTPDRDINGYGVTDEGEVVAARCDGRFFPNRIPRDASGSVCMTDID